MLNKRLIIQLLASIGQNSWFTGFVQGRIWTGKSKYLCVPGLNCYSCPGAWGSCPLGSLQAVIGAAQYQLSLYIGGMLTLFGVVFGRFICGWLCPFGLIQDLLYKIPGPKYHFRGTYLRYLKYVLLLVLVILLPLLLVNKIGMGDPWFCKLICPVGTLEGAVPLLALNPSLRQAVGMLFVWKLVVLVFIILLAVITYRPFCRFLCPLGAIYGLFNKISFVQLVVDKSSCVACGTCSQVCGMGVQPTLNSTSSECIRCGKCVSNCSQRALKLSLNNRVEVVGKNKQQRKNLTT